MLLLWAKLWWNDSRGPVGVAGGKVLLGGSIDVRSAEMVSLLASGGELNSRGVCGEWWLSSVFMANWSKRRMFLWLFLREREEGGRRERSEDSHRACDGLSKAVQCAQRLGRHGLAQQDEERALETIDEHRYYGTCRIAKKRSAHRNTGNTA